MKRIVSIMLLLVFALTLCACGNEESKVSCFDEQPVPKPQGLSFEEVLYDSDQSAPTYYYYFESDDTVDDAKAFFNKYIKEIEKQGLTSQKVSWIGTENTLICKDSELIALISLYNAEPLMLSITFDTDPTLFKILQSQ